MRFGLLTSLLLHACIVGAAFIALPESWRPDVAPEPYVPIELIADAEIAETTSVPAAQETPVEEPPEPDPQPEEPAEEAPAEEPAPVEETPEPEPEPVEPEPEPEPAPPEEEPTPEPPKEEPPKPEPPKQEPEDDDLDLDALSALVDKAKKEPKTASSAPSQTAEQGEEDRAQVGAGDRLTASETAKMRAAISRCWNASAVIGAPEPEKLKVIVEFDLNRDGTLKGAPRVANQLQINVSGNRFWKAAEQNAVRAVVTCQPYDFLSQDRYETWKEFQLNFDPTQMAGF
ncbi:MAG: hypothetical protein AAFQ96_01135 [Pseudomonadota bacterium]